MGVYGIVSVACPVVCGCRCVVSLAFESIEVLNKNKMGGGKNKDFFCITLGKSFVFHVCRLLCAWK